MLMSTQIFKINGNFFNIKYSVKQKNVTAEGDYIAYISGIANEL